SGPLTGDDSTFAQALEVLDQFGLRGRVPAVEAHLARGVSGQIDETPVRTDAKVSIIGSNTMAIGGAAEFLVSKGIRVLERAMQVQGEACEVGERFGRRLRAARSEHDAPFAILWGGETTVHVGEASGRGGPCQEFTLGARRELHGLDDVVVGAFATDGIDGPTDAAGAYGRGAALDDLPHIRRALHDHDAFGYFEAHGGLIRTGPTGSNVNDVMFGIVGAPS
ncbi:MAG: hypothetical protein KDA28_10660, partial [Phycisphaerales bacterium]|nr:hypothetical protein [Phycisphaerales bacterium]